MHWINPPHIIPLVEVIKGQDTADSTVQTVCSVCRLLKKKPVIVKDAPGFVLNRIQLAILRECLHIAEQGIATPEDIDNVIDKEAIIYRDQMYTKVSKCLFDE